MTPFGCRDTCIYYSLIQKTHDEFAHEAVTHEEVTYNSSDNITYEDT